MVPERILIMVAATLFGILLGHMLDDYAARPEHVVVADPASPQADVSDYVFEGGVS